MNWRIVEISSNSKLDLKSVLYRKYNVLSIEASPGTFSAYARETIIDSDLCEIRANYE